MKQMPESYYQMLEQLQSLDFVLIELTLYLDTHPEDLHAIEQFNQVSQQRALIKAEFEPKFGPLLQYGQSYSKYPWDWSESPWPWQV